MERFSNVKNDLQFEDTETELNPQFIFTSQYRSLVASGIACRISNKGLNQDEFIEAIKLQLNKLKADGEKKPIVIGAIPFDTSAETEFIIPESSTFSETLVTNHVRHNKTAQCASLSQVTDENHFKAAVNKALLLSEHTHLDKVVLSRAVDVETTTRLNANDMASTLYQQNPSAFIFSIPQSNGTTLIGASPELLVSKQDDHVISNPLAGSRKRTNSITDNQQISDELWQCEKDRYEHKLVADAVSNHLSPFCNTLNAPDTPSIIETSTMLHLSTKIEGKLASKSTSALDLAYALHPTPAICGTPSALAKVTIQHLEGYDRAQFCGAVGWMDAEGNGEWVVTIRCGIIKQKSIRLYAGAGIVKGSDPIAEFNETEAKLNTMLTALGLQFPSTPIQTRQSVATI
ncbi:isochorismate synthase MenF [uncultured Shewanella sp.]|uniref:isochorismate synthase n=1 Tax=uncultured Shewanella sp. TaxID=173975 RepID=UPI00262F5D89|nr:isochorismate synthase [uncultured Shewanella sp.]